MDLHIIHYTIIILLAFVQYGQSCSLGVSPIIYSFRRALKISIVFAIIAWALFQLGMILGVFIETMLGDNASLVSAIILLLVATKMILDAKRVKPIEKMFDDKRWIALVGIAIATSINHLLAGVAFGVSDMGLSFSLILFLTTSSVFLLSLLGIYLGKNKRVLTSNKINLFIGTFILFLAGFTLLNLYKII